jgi:hypothetical protein
LLAECKFHNHQETKNDLKIALYVKARMDDLKSHPSNQFDDFYLISNTSFSKDAIQYAACSNLMLLGYNYPFKKNLYQLIEEYHLYPITCIPWIKKNDMVELLESNVILVKDLTQNPNILIKMGYDQNLVDDFFYHHQIFLPKVVK